MKKSCQRNKGTELRTLPHSIKNAPCGATQCFFHFGLRPAKVYAFQQRFPALASDKMAITFYFCFGGQGRGRSCPSGRHPPHLIVILQSSPGGLVNPPWCGVHLGGGGGFFFGGGPSFSTLPFLNMNAFPDYQRLIGLLTCGRIINAWPDYYRFSRISEPCVQ